MLTCLFALQFHAVLVPKTPLKSTEILVKYTHRKANGNRLRSSSRKEQMTVFRVHFGLLRLGKNNSVILCPTHFFGGLKFVQGDSPFYAPLVTGLMMLIY